MKRLELLLISACLALTLGLSFYTHRNATMTAQDQFRRLAEVNVKSLQIRMATYLQSLNGAAAVLTSSDLVSRDDFSKYVSTLRIKEYLPGINGIGLITPIRAGEEAAFYEKLSLIGEDRLTITPETDGPERFIIERISPFESNEQALGLDITFEQGRREAAERARATGLPQLTPRILLVQDSTHQPGFLLLLPIYNRALDTVTRTSISSDFLGWVYAPFVGVNLLENLTADQGRAYNVSVYDGSAPDEDLLIFRSDSENTQNRFQSSHNIQLYGRDWLVAFESRPEFDAAVRNDVPLAILFCGLALTGMLAFSIETQRRRTDALTELAALRDKKIRASELENRAIVENAITPVFVLAGDDMILFANQAALRCFGYEIDEMRMLTFSQLTNKISEIPPDAEYNATGKTKSGQMLFLDVGYNQWWTSEGEPRVTAIVRDLSSEIVAVNELKRTKAIYDMALSGSRIGVFDVDIPTQSAEVSDTWCEIMGYPAGYSETNPKDLLRARTHPEDVHLLDEANEKAFSGETYRSTVEFRISFPNDEWRWMRSDAVVVERDEDGEPLRVIGTQTDVTDLRHARNALQQSEQQFRQVVAAAPIGMALMTSKGAFLSANDAFCTLCGHDEDYLKDELSLADIMPANEFRNLFEQLKPMVDAQAQGIYTGEHRLRHSSGAERWGLFNLSWNYDKNARSNMFIAQVNDITDRKEIEQVKNEFVSTVSHELRTPLTSIKGALGLIHASDGADLSDGSKRLVEIARSNTDRLAAIVNDILDLEKISSGEVAFEFAVCDMRDLITGTLKEMSPFAMAHGNTIRLDISDKPLLMSADASRTKQVLTNLISNACKYSDTPSEIVLRASVVDGQILTEIENIGPGIPDSFQSRIFEAFSQADASDTRAKGGTGLGLNISNQIVSRHNGQIGFKMTQDKTTVFWFSYPMWTGEELRIETLNSYSRKRLGHRHRVLHIEDDVDFAEVVRSGLRHAADVTHVTSVESARDAIADHEQGFEVVIVDWALPDADISGFLDQVFRDDPTTRILGLSAEAYRKKDPRIEAYLVKSRTELDVIAAHVSGELIPQA